MLQCANRSRLPSVYITGPLDLIRADYTSTRPPTSAPHSSVTLNYPGCLFIILSAPSQRALSFSR